MASADIQFETVPIATLRRYERNARHHSRKQIKAIAASIREFGFTNPILIDETGEIIAGHGRFEAASSLGMASVPVIRILGLEAVQKRALRLTGSSAPRISPKLLRLALAWHIQAKALGGLSSSSRRRLTQAAGGKFVTRPASAGMRLVREWQGVAHVVTIDESGTICWNDREWTSLSAVAHAITGSHWSGPAFFGLRKKVQAA